MPDQEHRVRRATFVVPGVVSGEDVGQYNAVQIGEMVRQLEESGPWRQLEARADDWRAAEESLTTLAVRIKTLARTLAGGWRGEDAVACQRALQRIEATARHLAERADRLRDFSGESARVVQHGVANFPWYGQPDGVIGEAISFVRDNPWTLAAAGSPPAALTVIGFNYLEENHLLEGLGHLDDEYRAALAALNDRYIDTNQRMPQQIQAELPMIDASGSTGFERDEPGDGGGTPWVSGPPSATAPRPEIPSPVPPPVDLGAVGPAGSGGDPPVAPGGRAGVPGGGAIEGLKPAGGGLAGVGAGGVPVTGPGGGIGAGGPGGGALPGGAAAGGAGGGPIAAGGVGLVPGAAGRPSAGGAARGGGGRIGAGGGRGTGGVGGAGVVAGPGAAGGGRSTGGRGAGGRGAGGSGAGGRSGGGAVPGGGTGGPGGGAARPGGAGGGMVPLAGGGRGRDGDKARPDSWLIEDDDPWRGDDELPPPPVLK